MNVMSIVPTFMLCMKENFKFNDLQFDIHILI